MRRSPHGERGLKSQVEIAAELDMERRSPHGERGLKWAISKALNQTWESLPTRGAWIEIKGGIATPVDPHKVAPHTGSVDGNAAA